jgi:Holliday junction resolvase-like predicted endonuclease
VCIITKLNKHDKYVEELVRRLAPEYDDISTHQKLERKKRIVGEIDIVARRGDKVHLFEVKCSYRIVKARKQLIKFKKIMRHQNTSCFFYFGEGNVIVEIC